MATCTCEEFWEYENRLAPTWRILHSSWEIEYIHWKYKQHWNDFYQWKGRGCGSWKWQLGSFQKGSEWKRSAEKGNLVRMAWTIFLPHTSYPIHLTGSDPICPIWSEIQIRYSCPSLSPCSKPLYLAWIITVVYLGSLILPGLQKTSKPGNPISPLPSRLWCLPVSPAGKVQVPYHSLGGPASPGLSPCSLSPAL